MRKGMWMKDTDGRVGIANNIAPDGAVEFHVVAKDGTTELVLILPAVALTQARFLEIPESRRTLTKEKFKALGYN